MKNFLSIACSVLLMFSCGSSQNKTRPSESTTVKVPADAAFYANTITSEELKEALYTYASDDFEGRDTGKPGQKKAVNYLKNFYVNLGIASPIAQDDYFQEVPLQIAKTPVTSLYVNGKAYNYFDDYVSLSASDSGDINTNTLVYLGYGIDDDKYSEYKHLDVNGKVVVVTSGEPKNDDGMYVISGTAEASKWSYGRQALSARKDAAKAHGASALIVIDQNLFDRYASILKRADQPSSRERLSLNGDDNSMLYFLVNESLGKALLADMDSDVPSATINKEFKLNYKNVSEKISSENVLAYIKGTEKPDEVVVISAHLDHEGIKNGEIYNGADDDGSGTVAILEIAEAFKEAANNGHGPKRSVLFLHVTAEEKGLLGSRYYTDNDPVFPLANTVANLNIDMIGRTDPKHDHLNNRNYLYLIGSDKLSTELHDLSEEVNEKYTKIDFDYTYNDVNDPNRFYYRSDHYNFAKNNVPVIFYFNGTHADYHQPSDTPDKIEYDLLENRTKLIFHTAWELANRSARIVSDKAKS